MALEEIIRRIEDETREKTKEIESGAKKEAEKILRGADSEAEKLKNKIYEETQKQIESERKKKLSLKRLELKKDILQAKHKILNDTFERAFDSIRRLPGEEYKNLIRKIFMDSAEPGSGKVYISAKDENRIDSGFLESINKALNESGMNCDYQLAPERVPIEGGFILEAGNVKIDCSLEALFQGTREKLEQEAGKILFSDG